MSKKQPEMVHYNDCGGIDGYVTDEGIFMWGNPAVKAERARRDAATAEVESRKLADPAPDVSAAPAPDPRVERVRIEADPIKAKWEARSRSQARGKGVER